MNDQDILDLYFARSESAISATNEKYGKYCHTVAMNILYSHEDSEECVNDTWLRAWGAIPPKRPAMFRTFLGKITRNLALNRWEHAHADKRGRGETAAALDELAECVADTRAGQPDQLPEQLTLTECINRFLEYQKPENRKLFVRRYWYLSDIKEIAGDYGFTESKVKMTLSRMRAQLMAELEKEGISW